jgi:hypothetical protein
MDLLLFYLVKFTLIQNFIESGQALFGLCDDQRIARIFNIGKDGLGHGSAVIYHK